MLKVHGRMHGNETDLKTNPAHTGSELDFSVGLSTMISYSTKRLNVVRERQEASLFYYNHLKVGANVN